MKKQLAFLTFFLCFNLVSYSQNKPLKFGLSLNPNYSYRVYSNGTNRVKQVFDSLEIGKFSYSVGLFVEKQVSDQLQFRLGLNFMNTGFKTIKQTLAWGSQNPNDPFNPTIFDPSEPTQWSFVFNNNFIEMPIDCQYFLQSNKPFFLNLGVSPSVNLSNPKIYNQYFADGTVTSRRQTNNQIEYQKFGLALQVGFGYEIKLGSKIRMDIQPRFQYFLTTLFNYSINTNDRLFNTGLQIDIKI